MVWLHRSSPGPVAEEQACFLQFPSRKQDRGRPARGGIGDFDEKAEDASEGGTWGHHYHTFEATIHRFRSKGLQEQAIYGPTGSFHSTKDRPLAKIVRCIFCRYGITLNRDVEARRDADRSNHFRNGVPRLRCVHEPPQLVENRRSSVYEQASSFWPLIFNASWHTRRSPGPHVLEVKERLLRIAIGNAEGAHHATAEKGNGQPRPPPRKQHEAQSSRWYLRGTC